MALEYNVDRKSQLKDYFSSLCVKCGSIHGHFDENLQKMLCDGCKNTWEYIDEEDYGDVLECLEHKFEIELDYIKIPKEFRCIDKNNREEVRAAEIAKFISENQCERT